jgi:hypothetical protein
VKKLVRTMTQFYEETNIVTALGMIAVAGTIGLLLSVFIVYGFIGLCKALGFTIG